MVFPSMLGDMCRTAKWSIISKNYVSQGSSKLVLQTVGIGLCARFSASLYPMFSKASLFYKVLFSEKLSFFPRMHPKITAYSMLSTEH